jgi:hypothetical protein
METGLFDIQAEHLRDYRQYRDSIPAACRHVDTISAHEVMVPEARVKADAANIEFARCFLRLANLPNFALDRLSRYEATLWRQAGRILFVLEALDRRKPQERRRGLCFGRAPELSRFAREVDVAVGGILDRKPGRV